MAPGQRRLRVHLPPSALGSPEDLLTHLKKQKTLSVSFETKQRTKQFVVQLQWPTKKQKDILGDLKPILTLQSYISVSSWFLLGFGLVFQTPMVIFLLVFIGIVTPDLLARYRRHAFVAILIISSILTPTGDPVNLMIMAIPMYILFEIGLWVSRVLITNPRERAAGTPSGDDGGGGSPPTTPWTTPPPDSTPPAEGQETSTPPASDASATLLSQEADVSEGETEVPKAEESAVEDSNVQEEGASEASTTAQESDRVDQSADRGEEASDERDEGPMEESAGAGEREPEPLPTIRPPEGTVSQIPMHQRVQSASQDEEETDKEQEETGTDQEEEDKPRG